MDQDHLSLLPYDVLRQVCASASSDLDGLSRSNKHLRDVSLPELFRKVVIEGSWEIACSRLEAMEERHDILTYVKIFEFNIYEGQGSSLPTQSTPSKLAKLLSAMPQLGKLVYIVHVDHSCLFEEHFCLKELVMPSVDVLVVGSYCEFMIARCPNVGIISTSGFQIHSTRSQLHSWDGDPSIKLIKAARAAPKLRHFEMVEEWRSPLLEAILESSPNITSIGMGRGNYGYPIHMFLPILSRFQNLRRLALTGAPCLGEGISDPIRANAYLRLVSEESLQHVISEIKEARKEAVKEAEKELAHTVFPVCANLKELWIGRTVKATVERYAGGGVRNITISEGFGGTDIKYPYPLID